MIDNNKPPFRFWSLFFSPKGRVSRKTIWYFAIPLKGVCFILGGMLSYLLNGQKLQSVAEGSWVIATTLIIILYVLLTWSIFAFISKRLHDLGLTAALALPTFISTAWSFTLPVIGATEAYAFMELYNLLNPVVSWINIYTILLIGVLAFLPGQKIANRFGQSIIYPTGNAAKHF